MFKNNSRLKINSTKIKKKRVKYTTYLKAVASVICGVYNRNIIAKHTIC